MELRVTVFARRKKHGLAWYTVGLGDLDRVEIHRNSVKLHQKLLRSLRERIEKLWPRDLELLEPVPGRKLEVVRLSMNLEGAAGSRRRIHGKFPLVLEPRTAGPAASQERPSVVRVFHPMRPTQWFVHEGDRALADEAAAFFRTRWGSLSQTELEQLEAAPKDMLRIVAFEVSAPSLASKLAKAKEKPAAFMGAPATEQGEHLLSKLGTNETLRATGKLIEPGMERAEYAARLAALLCGEKKTSVVLVGPSGAGKSTLIRRLIFDLLAADDFPSHRNPDRVHRVWNIRGSRIIAGMSYLGQWEQRCVELVETCRKRKVIPWVDDLSAWGRIGQSRESDRSLATFFRGPVSRRDIVLIGETTPEGYQQLQDDAPGFAGALTAIHVEPTDPSTTMRMLVHEARKLEIVHGVAFDPRAFRTIYELGGALGAGAVYPGKALDLLRTLASGDHGVSHDLGAVEAATRSGRKIEAIKKYREVVGASLVESKDAVEAFMKRGIWPSASPRADSTTSVIGSLERGGPGPSRAPGIGPRDVIRLLAHRTGMPEVLLSPERVLDPDGLRESFERQIMGQDEAVDAVCDLIVRIKAGMVDGSRPYGVFLFTGPTGTGKTEMAKCVAEYLYGDGSRLLRFDMSEYGGPDAPSRLIGDRFRPEGVLTSRIRTQPFSVVLLDEIEKADASVLNLLLQLFDDGRLTDATGTVVDFSHTVLIMTSNLGAKTSASVGFDEHGDPSSAADVAAAVREFFVPELFNRIDRVVSFGPLSREAAHRIARRELSRLLERRGLTERGVFVRYTPAVVQRVVAEGFRRSDGARSLKRWLEDEVGAMLADEIAASPSSEVRMYWLHRRGSSLALHAEALREAEPVPAPSVFEPMVGWTAERLRQEIPGLLEKCEQLRSSQQLERLAATIRQGVRRYVVEGDKDAAEPAYNLERLRQELDDLREQLTVHTEYDPRLVPADPDTRVDFEGELFEAERYARDEIAKSPWGSRAVKVIDRRHLGPMLPLQNRPAFLDAMANLHFLERAVSMADDPRRHAVLVELTRLSRSSGAHRFAGQQPGLLEWLAEAYGTLRGELDDFVAYDTHGLLYERNPAALGSLLKLRAYERVVLRIVGPAIALLLEREHGTHLRESLSSGTELVRVRVLDGHRVDDDGRPVDVSPRQHAEALDARREAFVAALETDARTGPLPDNPDVMLPIVRRYQFEPSSEGLLSRLEVEDYTLAFATRARVRRVADVLPSLWLLGMGAMTEVSP